MAGFNCGRFGKKGGGQGRGMGGGNRSVNSGRGARNFHRSNRQGLSEWSVPLQPEENTSLYGTDEYDILKEQIETTTAQLKAVKQRLNDNVPARKRVIARINDALCLNCMQCEAICPRGAIVMSNHYPQVQSDKCSGCGLCAAQCPAGAIEMV